MIPPKRFDIFFPLTEGCSEDLDTFRFFFEKRLIFCTKQSEVVGNGGPICHFDFAAEVPESC